MTDEEYVPVYHSNRVYLYNPYNRDIPVVGPIDADVMVQDTILCYEAKKEEQWACRVILVDEDRMAIVERI